MGTPFLTLYHIAEGVTAFSSTRHGGYGEGSYGEFNVNLYCGDDPEAIALNRKALCQKLGISQDRLIMPHQVHGTSVTQIGRTFFMLSKEVRRAALEGVDAVMTNLTDVCIGVSTADCIPIIIYDREHHAACAVHAGWRGTVKRITRKAVLAMVMAYHSQPEHLKAVIGPGISLKNFEVGDEVYDEFQQEAFPMEQIAKRFDALSPANGSSGLREQRWHIDLWEANRLQLHATGIMPENIQLAGICTYDNCDDYFSARRLGTASGRILTGIIIR